MTSSSTLSCELNSPIETKESDQFPTDDLLLQVFREWYDPCPLNATPVVDGLSISWKDKTYCNPPYSNVMPWVLKGIEEYKQGKRIVFLLKFDSTTKWYRALLESGAHFLHIGERLHHGAKYASPFPSVLVILTPTSLNTKASDIVGGYS